MSTGETKERSVTHGTFMVERDYPHPPPRVFAAFTRPEAIRAWLVEGEGWGDRDGGTHLMLTEQGAFLDGNDGLEDRKRGTGGLLDELGAWLDTASR